jgi:putative ABC transport system permease protein
VAPSRLYTGEVNKLVFGNLIYRPLRSSISVLAIALEVILMLVITGIMVGQLADTKMRASGIGADMIVGPSTASFVRGVSGAPLSIKVADVLRKMPHVDVVAPVAIQVVSGATFENIYGIDYESFNGLKLFHYQSGGPFQGPDDMIIDDYAARSGKGYKVGDTMLVLNHSFRVCGIVDHGKGGRKFVPLQTLGQLTGAENKASLFYLKTDDEKNEGLVKQEIAGTPGMGQYQVQTIEEWLSLVTQANLPTVFTTGLNVVIGIAMIIGFIVIFQSMYTAVLERTREIGILKSLGATEWTIVNVVLREVALLTVAGIALGYVLSFGVKAFIIHQFPTLLVVFTPIWMVRATLLSLIGALLGAMYPAWKAARKDPIDALAYE